MSVGKQSSFERRIYRRKNRYDFTKVRGNLARSQISSQHGRKELTEPSHYGIDFDSSIDKSRFISNASTPSRGTNLTLFKALDYAIKDIRDDCLYERYKTNAGVNLLSPPPKKSKLIKLKERLIKEIEAVEPNPVIQIRPFEMAISYKEPTRRRPVVSLSQVTRTHLKCKVD